MYAPASVCTFVVCVFSLSKKAVADRTICRVTAATSDERKRMLTTFIWVVGGMPGRTIREWWKKYALPNAVPLRVVLVP